MIKPRNIIIFIVVAVVLFLFSGSLLIVRQTEQALILSFGQPLRIINGVDEDKPGIYLKKPFFLETVVKFDKRIMHFDADAKLVSISGLSVGGDLDSSNKAKKKVEIEKLDEKKEEKKEVSNTNITEDVNTSRIIVDAFAKYRINNPLDYYQAGFTDSTLRTRLDAILESNLRKVIGTISLDDLLTSKRREVMEEIRNKINAELSKNKDDKSKNSTSFGIEIVDVRIKRTDLVPDNYFRVVNKMKAEFEKAAREFRAQGAEEAQKITAEADKEKTILLAEADKKSKILKGQGEAEATKTYSAAYSLDRNFYEFYRSLEAYKNSLKSADTKFILSPDSEFLKFMNKNRDGE
jgi:membrane protease subunit HflC